MWGWGPILGPGHPTPGRAAEALTLLRPLVAVPIHWGTFYLAALGAGMWAFLVEPPRRFARRAALVAPRVRIEIAPPGGRVPLER